MLKIRKGIVIPVVGTLLIVVSIIFIYTLTQSIETKQRTVMLKGEIAISGQNQAEITKRFAVLAFDSIALKGAKTVPKDCENIPRTKKLLVENIGAGLPTGTIELNKYKKIEWAEPELEISSTRDTDFNIRGEHVFLFIDSRIGMTLKYVIPYDIAIESDLFDC